MSAMKEEVYGEAIVDIVKPETLVSDPVIIKVREKWIEKQNKDILHGHIPFSLTNLPCSRGFCTYRIFSSRTCDFHN